MSNFEDPPNELIEMLRVQLLANEQLVLAAVRAHEEIDRVVEQRLATEREVGDLRIREKVLESTVTFRERLLEIVGSDLSGPLAKIVSSAESMARRGDLRPSDAAQTAQIVSVGARLTSLIAQLVDYTQARSKGTFSLAVSPIDYGWVCEGIAAQLRVPGSVSIRQTQSGNCLGSGDSVRVTDALYSIVRHAVECSEPGTPVLVHCRPDEEADRIVVQVSNRGPCLPADRLALVLGAFNRGELSGHSGFAHLGLGLMIASQVAVAHRGRVDVQSAEGLTTFTIELPRHYVLPPAR